MQVLITESPARVGELAAALIAGVVAADPGAVLGLATGSSPLATYAELARRVREDGLDLSRVQAFALDEYAGLDHDHPQSYHSVLRREVAGPLGIPWANVHVPDGMDPDLRAACERYERRIAELGPVAVQLLGIGANGHIGFNEPTSSFGSRTRVKTLAPATRADNARFFASEDQVPTHCLTQGLATILSADRLLLVANGTQKADAVAATIEGPVSSMCPGSALQLHAAATVIVDEDAAAGLALGDYYRYTAAHLPAWQRLGGP